MKLVQRLICLFEGHERPCGAHDSYRCLRCLYPVWHSYEDLVCGRDRGLKRYLAAALLRLAGDVREFLHERCRDCGKPTRVLGIALNDHDACLPF